MVLILRIVFLWLAAGVLCGTGQAQQPQSSATRDPLAILASAKKTAGGDAIDKLSTQHSKVRILTGGIIGNAERWSDMASGRSYLKFSLGSYAGTLGYDGSVGWSQDPSGQTTIERTGAVKEIATNAAYRDQLAYWFPARHPADIQYKKRATADGADFDVISVTPAGGREFELWVNLDTKLIERLVEREATAIRTENYMDWHEVDGVMIPYRVRTSRGDPKFDEVIVVDNMEFNAPLTGISFAPPEARLKAASFPPDKTAVELPFEMLSGHIYVRLNLNGKGPYRMLLDSGAINVALPELVEDLGLKTASPATAGGSSDDSGSVHIDRIDVAGIAIEDQTFAVIPLAEFMHRVEGLDDVAGVIGFELFRRFPVKIDYQSSRITLYDPNAWTYKGSGVAIPFQFKDHTPQVQGSVDGVDGAFDIDTGSRSALMLAEPFARQNAMAEKVGAKREIISGAGPSGYTRALIGRATTLKLGEITIANPVTYVSTATSGRFADPDIAGNVGNAALRRFSVTFDYPHQKLYFEKNANFGEPDVHERAGLWVEQNDKGYVVVEVVPESAAAQAGLKAGDVVVAIDSKPASSLTLSEFRQRLRAAPGTKLRLKLESGPTRTVTLRNMV
jgi:predicted aspartyl protease